MFKYPSNIFEIPPKSDVLTSQQNTQLLPLIHRNYYVLNIGRVPIKAEVLYGTPISWYGTAVGSIEVKPGEEAYLDMTKTRYLLTTVKIYNENLLRALVHIGRDDGYDWNQKPKAPLKLDINAISKHIVKFTPGNIPSVEDKLDPIIVFFFPQKGIIWGIVIDETVQIHAKIKSDLRQLRTKLINLNALLEHREYSTGTSVPYQYMQLMEDVIGFEKKFTVSQEAINADYINYISLPYYSTMVSLKLCLYQFGIVNRNKVALNDEQVRRLLLLSKQLIEERLDGALPYINRVFKQAINNEYNSCDPQLAYDSFATVRTYCGLGGLEFLSYWNGILTNPFWKKKVYNDVTICSTYFGRPSPLLYKQLHFTESQSVNKMVGLDVWLWRRNSKAPPKIGGISVRYLNGEIRNYGSASREGKSFVFNDSFLVKITAWGEGAIDCLEFTFSDGRKQVSGSKEGTVDGYRIFELEKHYISGIFLANDVPLLNGQAANMAVCFQVVAEPLAWKI